MIFYLFGFGYSVSGMILDKMKLLFEPHLALWETDYGGHHIRDYETEVEKDIYIPKGSS